MHNKFLRIKEDEFSWQGTIDEDKLLFIRRLKSPNQHIFSDINFGSASIDRVALLVASFIEKTEWPNFSTFIVTNISPNTENEITIRQRYHDVVQILSCSLKSLGFIVTSYNLAKDFERNNAVIHSENLVDVLISKFCLTARYKYNVRN